MTTQLHRVLRQTIEVTVRGTDSRADLHAELRRIHDRHLVAILERCCSALSDARTVERIPRLEVDLGYLDFERFEQDLIAKFEASLQQALARALPRDASRPGEAGAPGDCPDRSGSDLELLTLFARTGRLPWWADVASDAVAHAVESLVRSSPAAFSKLIRGLMSDPRALRRLAVHLGEAQTERIASLVAPVLRPSVAAFFATLSAALRHVAARVGAARMCASAREALIRAVALHQAALRTHCERAIVGFWREVFEGFALAVDVQLDAILAAWAASAPGSASSVIHVPDDGESPSVRDAASEWADSGRRGIMSQIVELLRESRRGWPPTEAGSGPVSAGPGARTAGAPAVDGERTSDVPRGRDDEGRREASSRGDDLLHGALGLRRADDDLVMPAADTPAAPATRGADPRAGDADGEARVDLSFSDSDEAAVDNCGLVLLWPFLPQLFKILELVDDSGFRSEAAAHRGAGLLQYVAMDEPDLSEYRLTLNKVLCGLGSEDLFEFGEPATEREVGECERMLAAAVAQAPMLGSVSPEGFRASFLQRSGLLSGAAGHWLLRVERRSFDLVLDRLPWRFDWIKLPWMTDAMRIEWR